MEIAYHGKARKLLSIVIIGTIVGMLLLGWANIGMAQELYPAPDNLIGVSYYNGPNNYIYLNCEMNIPSLPITAIQDINLLIYRGETSDNLTLIANLGLPIGNVQQAGGGDYYPSADYVYVDRNIVIEHTYYYQVSLMDSIGEGPRTDTIEVYNPSPVIVEIDTTGLTVPSPPQNVTAAGGNGQIILTWDTSFDGGSMVTEIRIYRRATAGTNSLIHTSDTLITSYIDTGVDNQQTYYYTLYAVNISGWSNVSAEVSTMASDAYTIPSPPQNLRVSIGEVQNNLSWETPEDNGGSTIIYYNIYRGTAEGQETFYQKVGNVQGYADTNVVAGQGYYYTVSAVNGVGEGPQAEAETSSGIPGFTWGIAIIAVLFACLIVGASKK